MKTIAQLLASHCRAVEGAAMSDADIAEQIGALDRWRVDAGALTKMYRFANYYETLAFVNALATIVHREDHHPELRVGYDRCEVHFNTHSVSGISENDFICAAKADALHSQRFAPA